MGGGRGHSLKLVNQKNTIRNGGNTALYNVDTADTIDTDDMVYTVDLVYTVDMLYTLDTE